MLQICRLVTFKGQQQEILTFGDPFQNVLQIFNHSKHFLGLQFVQHLKQRNMKRHGQSDINCINLIKTHQLQQDKPQTPQSDNYHLQVNQPQKIILQQNLPERPLVLEFSSQFIHNRIPADNLELYMGSEKQQKGVFQQIEGLHIFKLKKKQKVRSKCDYDKNICGYITKKIIREFVSEDYQKEVLDLVVKQQSNYAECKGYYLKKVQFVTGPSHLPELLHPAPNEPENISKYKKVFKQFYRWFLRERYLRYLLVEGKMANKKAYIQYKNSHLFTYVQKTDEYPQKREVSNNEDSGESNS